MLSGEAMYSVDVLHGGPARGGWLVGRSPEIQKLLRILDKVAISSHPVLILGESGTGKELVAREIHARGLGRPGPFAVVDCESAAPAMLARDLFGHCPADGDGAWEKDGLLCAAAGGTVFLDEVGALSPELQTMLLRALQAKEVRSFGTAEHRPVTARILAGSSRNLQVMVDAGAFRKDLYYRLNVVKLQIPALRERREDLPELVRDVLRRMEQRYGRRLELSREATEMVRAYAGQAICGNWKPRWSEPARSRRARLCTCVICLRSFRNSAGSERCSHRPQPETRSVRRSW